MKLKCGPSTEAKFKAEQEWHSWFAWRPVRVAEGDCRWLERVERRFVYAGSAIGLSLGRDIEYRAPPAPLP